MNRVVWMTGALLMAASFHASAQPGPRGGMDGPRGGGARFERMPGQDGGPGGGRGREFRRDERRGEQGGDSARDAGGNTGPRRDGGPMGQGPAHLSPDERRQLRREIHEAGRDIYRPRRFER